MTKVLYVEDNDDNWRVPGLPIIGFLMLGAFLFALPYWFGSPQMRVQWQGMLFQWAGVIIVAWGLADTRHRLFHKRRLLQALWDGLRRLSYIIKPPPPIILSAAPCNLGKCREIFRKCREDI